MDKRDSIIISSLRFPLIVLVVFSHNGGFGGYDSMNSIVDWTGPWQSDLYDFVRLAVRIFASQATMQCFYFMSGFLYFYSVSEWNLHTYLAKSKKRISTLVIPYILWNMIAMLYPVIVHILLGVFCHSHYEKALFYWNELDWIHDFWDAGTGCPYLFPLWYIKALIVFCILTPFLYPLLKGKYGWLTVLTFLLLYSSDYIEIYIRYIAFFAAGAYFGIHKICISNLLLKFKKFTYILAIILYSLLMLYNYDCGVGHLSVVRLWNVIGCILMFTISLNLINTGFSKLCGALSITVFFILGLHNMDFMFTVDAMIGRFYQYDNVWLNIFFYIVIPLIKVGICLVVYYFMSKAMPRTLKVLTGGR